MTSYLLLKRKKSTRWEIAVPLKKGVSKAQAQKAIRTGVRPGYQATIVSAEQLKRLLAKMKPTRATKGTRRGSSTRRKRRSTTSRRTKPRTRVRYKRRKR